MTELSTMITWFYFIHNRMFKLNQPDKQSYLEQNTIYGMHVMS